MPFPVQKVHMLPRSTPSTHTVSQHPPARVHKQVLPLLAPKPPHRIPVQHRLQFEYNNIRDGQHTGAPVKLQYHATSQPYIPLKFDSSSHNVTSSSLRPTVSSLEWQQHAATAPCTTMDPSGGLSASADAGFLHLTHRNPLPWAREVTGDSIGLLTQYPPYGNLQLQETTQDRHDCIPTLGAPEVNYWTAMAQSTVGVPQS